MIKKHWTPSFAFNKLVQTIQTKKEKDCPWISYDAVKFLKQYLKSDDIILETGSGRSTIWFSKLVKKVVSIEHHEGWFNTIKAQMASEGITNVDYYLESKEFSSVKIDAPYIKRVASFPDQSFDMVLIDGRHRDEIAMLSLNLIKKKGIIVIDNIERTLYIPGLSLPDSIKSPNQMTQTWKLFFNKVENNRKVIFDDGLTSAIVIFAE
jgi:predicted O-methyltransferase YrrM